MGDASLTGSKSMLFQPMSIANGKIKLKHRVVFAPLTRNRGTPLKEKSTAENPNRIWMANDLMADYYGQRTTDGGLLVSEGIPPSLEVRIHPMPDKLHKLHKLPKVSLPTVKHNQI